MRLLSALACLLVLAANAPAQTGYYRDDYGRAYYRDAYGQRHYLYDAYVDRYGYRYYVDQYGQRRYLYDGEYVGPMAYETRQATFDIGRVGGLGRPETEAAFKAIWTEFRKCFALTEDGGFQQQPQANTPDNERTRAAFLRFVAEQSPEVTVPFTEKCTRCDGNGYKVGLVDAPRYYYYNNDRRMQSAGQKRCDACNGSGGTRGVTIYRLTYGGKVPGAEPRAEAKARAGTPENLTQAEQGDASAQFALAEYFWMQEGKAQDPAAANAIKWYGRSLLGGNSVAADRLVEVYALPHPVLRGDLPFARALQQAFQTKEPANSAAAGLLRSSAQLDAIEARTLAGRILQAKAGPGKAAAEQCLDPKFIRRSFLAEQPDLVNRCKSGDAAAIYRLGLCYATGLGVTERNGKVAAIWLEQAAAKGNADAFYILGALYEDGVGYPRNPTAAHALYTVAAQLFSTEWSPWERATALADSVNVAASGKAAAALLELTKAKRLTPDHLHALSSLPPKLATANGEREPAAPDSRATYASGIVFTKLGHLFTSASAVANARAIAVLVRGESGAVRKLPARVIKVDARNDLVLLQCEDWKPADGSPAEPPPITPSRYCRLGDAVFSLGYGPTQGPDSSVRYSKGDVSALNAPNGDAGRIQHTIVTQPGAAGGPLCLLDGRVIGIADAGPNLNPAPALGGPTTHLSPKSDHMLALAQAAGIEVPITFVDGLPVEHVKAYTVQLLCEN